MKLAHFLRKTNCAGTRRVKWASGRVSSAAIPSVRNSRNIISLKRCILCCWSAGKLPINRTIAARGVGAMETVSIGRSAANQSWGRRRDRNWRNFARPGGRKTEAVRNDGETETCRLAELALEEDQEAAIQMENVL